MKAMCLDTRFFYFVFKPDQFQTDKGGGLQANDHNGRASRPRPRPRPV